MEKSSVILAAQSLGYFRAKSDSKKSDILAEMLELEEYSDKASEVSAILESETMRRHVVSQARAKRAIEKQQADENKPLTAGADSAKDHIAEYPAGVYIVTVAQNNTDVNPTMLAALEQYAKHNDAKILVAKTTYNKNGFQQPLESSEGIYYDSAIAKYLVDGQLRLGGKIDFCAQANVIPTAKNPLSGFAGITEPGIDVIIPAVKIALQCTAALKGGQVKRMFSTGAITKRNYITRKAGAVAATEHNIGALVVDTRKDGPAIVRQLELMHGCNGFYDGSRYYSVNGVSEVSDVTAIQFGDIHAEKMTDENLKMVLSLIAEYNPKNVILHDIMDFSSRNHHNIKDCAFMFAQSTNGNTVENDIQVVADTIDAIAAKCPMIHVIESNHDLAINTWLKNTDFKADPINAWVYLKCMLALYEHIAKSGNTDFNMLEYACKNIGNMENNNVVFHDTDESVIIAGVEMGIHGHTGINGAKGSPASFRSLGVPMNTGHTHTPSINGACYTAGVSGSLEMGYNVGPSSWQLAHIVTYDNGQRQVIFS